MLFLFLGLLFLLLFAGVPVAISLLVSASAMLFQMDMFDSQILAENFVGGTNNFPLMAIPFFMLTGEIMNKGGISLRIINFARTMCGHIKGGMGYVVIISGVIFAGLSGSAVADTAALGAILIPMMLKNGYEGGKATGLLCATGIISVVIPPSIPFIVYGVTAGASITKLFMGGIVPGLMMGFGLWFCWKFLMRKEGLKLVEEKATKEQRIASFKQAFFPLLLPILIIVGLRGGIFTPTEAGCFAAIYALLVSIAYREFKLSDLIDVCTGTIKTTAIVMFVAAAASISGYAVAVAQIPQEVVQVLGNIASSKTEMLIILMVFLLLVGCVMDLIPATLIFLPVIIPLLRIYHIDLAYFGVLMVINLSIGLITPPVGTVLYVGSTVGGVDIAKTIKGILPFLLVHISILFLLVFFPAIVTVPMNYLS